MLEHQHGPCRSALNHRSAWAAQTVSLSPTPALSAAPVSHPQLPRKASEEYLGVNYPWEVSGISPYCTPVTGIGFSCPTVSSHLPAKLSWRPCLAEQQPSPEANTPKGPCRDDQSWQRSHSTPKVTFPLSRDGLSPKAAQRRQQELDIPMRITRGDLAIRAEERNGRKNPQEKENKEN